MVTSENWGVAVLSRRAARLFRAVPPGRAPRSRRAARLFRGGSEGLVKFARVQDELHRRHAQGGWSQARFQRGIEQQVAEHARHVAELLLRAHRRRPFDQLAIVASDELWPVVEASLHHDLRDRLAGVIKRDLEHAAAEEILQAVSPVVERAEHDRERALISRLEEALGTGGAATAGLDEVLATFERERVEVLLVADRASLTAGLCSLCGRLSASGDGTCQLDGAPLVSVDAIEHLIALAAQRSVDVVVVRHELDALREHGHVAALLRW
jgi:peptide chain release factor subunit 1